MKLKLFSGAVAMILALAFLAPPLIKIKDPALAVVIAFGVCLMALDLWQSLFSNDD